MRVGGLAGCGLAGWLAGACLGVEAFAGVLLLDFVGVGAGAL